MKSSKKITQPCWLAGIKCLIQTDVVNSEIPLLLSTWRPGYCYLNNGECNYNQSRDDSFVERVAKNNS